MGVNSENPIIQLVGLGRQFRAMNGPVTALEDINLEIRCEEVSSIIGLSDAGKGTLVRYINYLEVPTPGRVIFEGKDLSVMKNGEKRLVRQSMGMISQQLNLLSQRDAPQNAYFPLEIVGVSKAEAKKRAEELSTLVGLEDRMKAYPAQLSGGQKQRVITVRAMATNPEVLLRDETTNALSPSATKSILELLKRMNREMGITVIAITHEMTAIKTTCGRVTIIDHNHITEAGDVSDIFSGPRPGIDRQLIPGDVAGQSLSFGNSRQIRIAFDGRGSSEPVIANMVPVCKIPVNIMYADTRDVEDKAMGRMLIQLPEDDTDTGRTCNCLKTVNVKFEEVR